MSNQAEERKQAMACLMDADNALHRAFGLLDMYSPKVRKLVVNALFAVLDAKQAMADEGEVQP